MASPAASMEMSVEQPHESDGQFIRVIVADSQAIFRAGLRKVSEGHPWLDSRGVQWVLEAFRGQGVRPVSQRPKVQLTPKESLIVSCVTQGMKNKEIALRVGTTEQVVKNYLRKVYDKLGVADRLELALYCLNHSVVDANTKGPAAPVDSPATTNPIATPLATSVR